MATTTSTTTTGWQYLISARGTTGSGSSRTFRAEPGRVRYLKAPNGQTPTPGDEIKPGQWAEEVRDLADGKADGKIWPGGDVLIYVHGYNNTIEEVIIRQRILQSTLSDQKWNGVVVSFDWPSDNSVLNYLEDRWDASEVALELVTRGVTVLARGQAQGCETNVHLLGHSTGAFVIMDAFAVAQKKKDLFKNDWRVAQVAFISGDVASESLARGSDWAGPMYHRIMRLTNYSNPFDAVLAASNAKRLGVSPRAGRVGLPPTDELPEKAVNVNCGAYFKTIDPKKSHSTGTFCHSWQIGDPVFALDLALTLEGRIDRSAIPTRRMGSDGEGLILQAAARPTHEDGWY